MSELHDASETFGSIKLARVIRNDILYPAVRVANHYGDNNPWGAAFMQGTLELLRRIEDRIKYFDQDNPQSPNYRGDK